jgi:5-methylcytosine-specific restriction endonuclease McrA
MTDEMWEARRDKREPDDRFSTTYGWVVESRLRGYKKRAAQRGKEWTLDDEEARQLLMGDCHYCGRASDWRPRRIHGDMKQAGRTNGIDRLDNDRGYVPGNCVSACYGCNIRKHTYSYDDFVAWIRLLHQRLCEPT